MTNLSPAVHPITPPPELVRQWCAHSNKHETYDQFWCHIAHQAARWGADQELEACCEWLEDHISNLIIDMLRAARRPKPPSLKEEALALLDDASDRLDAAHENIIRRALEALPE